MAAREVKLIYLTESEANNSNHVIKILFGSPTSFREGNQFAPQSLKPIVMPKAMSLTLNCPQNH